jgi:beta-mannosidase
LNGRWKVKPAPLACRDESGLSETLQGPSEWIPATVPGEIHLDLMRAGQMPEPLVGSNAHDRCRWPEQHSWWYCRDFVVPPGFLKHERIQLICDGLDLSAQIFLNGRLAGEAANAFVPVIVDAAPYLATGANQIAIRLTCGSELAEGKALPAPYKTRETRVAYKHRRDMQEKRALLRKPQFEYGWDWVDTLPNIGIWRGVRIEAKSLVVLHDLRLDTVFHDSKVWVRMDAVIENLHRYSERAAVLTLSLTPPKGKPIVRTYPVQAQVGRSPVRDTIEIPAPQLWWPNGLGEQPLYLVEATLSTDRILSDRRTFHFGLRTVRVDQTPRKVGRRFCVQVNGQDVFCKGGNWVPADAILARVDQAKYETLVAEAKAAHYTMLRVWGGGIYEDEAFYNACDRAGILIWQDFMFACTDYPCHDAAFRSQVRDEAESAVLRLRHHPCIALWCGNNENISWLPGGRGEWGWRLYEQVLPDVCRLLDPERFYWPSSPSGGVDPRSVTEGDVHPWPYVFGKANLSADAIDHWKTRFVTEFGAIGPPVMDSIRDYLAPEDRRLDSPVWAMHTNSFELGLVRHATAFHYADPDGLALETLMHYGMLFQAFIYGHLYESARFRKLDPEDDSQGFLIWMYNDSWGEIGWSIIDYYLRRKPSWYAVRRACRPVKVITRRRQDRLVTRVVNDTLASVTVTVRYGWMRPDGHDARCRSRRIRVPANGMVEIADEAVTPAGRLDPATHFYAATLTGKDLEDDQAVMLLAPYRQMQCAKPSVRVTVRGREIELCSPVYCHMVHVEDHGGAVLSDNYFDLLPNVPRQVTYLGRGKAGSLRFRAAGGVPIRLIRTGA